MLCPQCSELSNETKKRHTLKNSLLHVFPVLQWVPMISMLCQCQFIPQIKSLIQLLTLMPMGSKPIISNRKPKTALKMHFNFKEMSS